jgi:hypothetical protein
MIVSLRSLEIDLALSRSVHHARWLMMCGVEVGMGVGPVGFSVEQQNLLWVMWRRGDSIREMERTLGETLPRIRRFLRQSGGIPPVARRRRAGHLSLVEREEISVAMEAATPTAHWPQMLMRLSGRGARR